MLTQQQYTAAVQIAVMLLNNANVDPRIRNHIAQNISNSNTPMAQQFISYIAGRFGHQRLSDPNGIHQQEYANVINPIITAWVAELQAKMFNPGMIQNSGMGIGGMNIGSYPMNNGSNIYDSPDNVPVNVPQPMYHEVPRPVNPPNVQHHLSPIEMEHDVMNYTDRVKLQDDQRIKLEPGLVNNKVISCLSFETNIRSDVRVSAAHFNLSLPMNNDLEAVRAVYRLVPEQLKIGKWIFYVQYPKLTVLNTPTSEYKRLVSAVFDKLNNSGNYSLSGLINAIGEFKVNDWNALEKLLLPYINKGIRRYIRKSEHIDTFIGYIDSFTDLAKLEDSSVSKLRLYHPSWSYVINNNIIANTINNYIRPTAYVDPEHDGAVEYLIMASSAYYQGEGDPSDKYKLGPTQEVVNDIINRYTVLYSKKRCIAITNALPGTTLNYTEETPIGANRLGVYNALWSSCSDSAYFNSINKSIASVYGVKEDTAPELFLREYDTIVPIDNHEVTFLSPVAGIPGL